MADGIMDIHSNILGRRSDIRTCQHLAGHNDKSALFHEQSTINISFTFATTLSLEVQANICELRGVGRWPKRKLVEMPRLRTGFRLSLP